MGVTKLLSIISISLCVLLLCSWVVADTEETEGPSDVLVLTTENFQETISASPLIAVEFYSPWCGHCKSLAPEWEKAATALKGKVPVAKVDCTASGDICDANEVQGYPTLKLFREGEASPMEVARKSEAIVAFLTKETEPAVKVLKTSAELDEFIAAHPLTVVGYLDNDHDDRWAVFKEVALKKRHTLDFVAIISAEWAAHSSPAVVLHKNFEEPKVVYSGEFVGPAISTWVSRSILPTLGEINVDTFPNYVAADLSVLGYFFVDPNDETTAALLKEVEAKLVAYKDDFKVAWINNNKYAQQATRLGLSSKIPSIVLDNHLDGVKFIFPEDQTLSSEALGEWFAQYKAGSLKPHVKSEPIPETNDGPVKVLVAHNFKDIVYDETKDVLVEFYAPWCGHCKSLAPTWEQLGSLFADAPSVVIAKIDATANDVPPKLNIRGFPTIILFPGNNKDTPVEYQGTRSLEDLAKFVRDNAATKVDNVEVPQEEEEHDDDDHDHEGCDHDHSHDHEEAKPADKDEL